MRRELFLRIHREDHSADALGRVFLGVEDKKAALALVQSYLGSQGRLKTVSLEGDALLVGAEVREFTKESRNLLRMGRESVRKGRPRSALGHYEEALKLSPWNADALKALGRLYYRNRQSDAARRLLIRAREADPTDGTVLSLLAEIALHENRRLAARGYLEQLQRLEPDSLRTRRALARVQPTDAYEATQRLADIPEPPVED
jgi:Flp pilus assembly protein TadD